MPARRRLIAAVAFLCVLPASARAATPSVPLSDYIQTSWTAKDGLPSDVIWSIAQDREGYLWLGTNEGLVRFDGARFVTVESVAGASVSRQVARSLWVARDGNLWVGFGEHGGISRIGHGRVRSYGVNEGLPPGIVNAIAEDSRGTIWAGSDSGLFRLTNDRWQRVEVSGLPIARVDSVFVDRAGNLIVGTSEGVFRTPADETVFRRVDRPDRIAAVFRGFSQDASGKIWVTDPVEGFRGLGEHAASARAFAGHRGNVLLHDREGSLWIATMGGGIWRVTHSPDGRRENLEKVAAVGGARFILEDRDGQIWAAAGDGLVRLARPKVTRVTNLGPVFGVQATPDGSVWARTADRVIRFPGADDASRGAQIALKDTDVRTLRADERGGLWVVTNSRIVRLSPRFQEYSVPTWPISLTRINVIESDRHGGLWLADLDHGLVRWSPQRPRIVDPVRELVGTRITALYTDGAGRLWFGTTAGQVGAIDPDGALRRYGAADGLGVGPYTVLLEDSRRTLWVGGGDGLTRFSGGHFIRIVQDRFRGGVVLGIAEDLHGDLWLGTASGIVCVTRRELDKAETDATYSVHASVFDAADGLAGLPINFGNPTSARASDGRLWFITGRGMTAFVPQSLETGRIPPGVTIERVEVDEHQVMPIPQTLPPRTTRVQIDYSALDLATPWKTRFRYQLKGFDAGWIEAGTGRRAVYTRLPPGTYQFRVASNNIDGSWSDAALLWGFSMHPMFYQTYWFYAACPAVVGLMTWAAWRVRVRRIRKQFALLIGERARLSREIHDTLLQSLVGVALQFDVLCAGLDAASPMRAKLIRTRRQVEEYIREARHSIWNLRTLSAGSRELPVILREAAQRVTQGRSVGLEFSIHGTPYQCPSETEEQLVRICQEAVLNAVRHADASEVRVELRYAPDYVALRVSDNGHGFDPAVAEPLEAAGHYGLVGMRERAADVGGAFTLTTSLAAGTVIEARVPVTGHAA